MLLHQFRRTNLPPTCEPEHLHQTKLSETSHQARAKLKHTVTELTLNIASTQATFLIG